MDRLSSAHGRTDIALNERGEHNAPQLGEQLRGRIRLSKSLPVRYSELREPANWLALVTGLRSIPSCCEWDYDSFEGKLTNDILQEQPGWQLYRDGCPGGESPNDVAARADRFISRVRGIEGDVLAFSSGHIIRMIAARWLGLPPAAGRFFYCRPASVGVLGYEHNSRDEPIIREWNYIRLPRE